VKPITASESLMGIAEFIIGPAEDRTRWLNPSYRSSHFNTPLPAAAPVAKDACSR
jgi:hypothetical protein